MRVNPKTVFLVLLSLALLGLAFWIVVGPWFPQGSMSLLVVCVFFAGQGIGGNWMLYMVIRNEKQPLPIVFLAFLPYAFLWYYFERVRHGKHKSREVPAS